MIYGTYVHVPWCRRRCPYCAFYVEVDRDVPWDRFVDAVLAEAAMRGAVFPGRSHTLYLGGGTPSRLPADALSRLIDGLPASAEVTVEANPEDVSDDWLAAALDAGVTRLSLGVQTFEPAFARMLNRASTVHQARETVARVAGTPLTTWSVDVIFALPGQTLADLRRDVDAILSTDPPHVSLYGLTYEPGTAFERARDKGAFVPLDDDLQADMIELLVDALEGAGLHRYEVSNFARPGHESVHNRLYWTDAPYLGLGPSAHGYAPDGRRWVNVADVEAYLDRADPTESIETPSPHQAATDQLLSGLRGVDGVDLERIRDKTGLAVDPTELAALRRLGVVAWDGRWLRLDGPGWSVADGVTRRVVGALVDPSPG